MIEADPTKFRKHNKIYIYNYLLCPKLFAYKHLHSRSPVSPPRVPPYGSKIYISQIYKEHIGGFILWVAADQRLLGCSPVGDVDVPLPQLHSHTAVSRAKPASAWKVGRIGRAWF